MAEQDNTVALVAGLGILGGIGFYIYQKDRDAKIRAAQLQAQQMIEQHAITHGVSPRQAAESIMAIGCRGTAAYYTSGASEASGVAAPICNAVASYADDIAIAAAKGLLGGAKGAGKAVTKYGSKLLPWNW